MSPAAPLWRVFPWESEAENGAPFSASFLPPQGAGRFDLPGAPVLYLAQTPGHAVAEIIQGFRGSELEADDLTQHGRALALVAATPADTVLSGVADCCDPAELVRLGVWPDTLASGDIARSQSAARAVYEFGHTGLRWWSALRGDWHTTVLFMDRVAGADLDWGVPDPLGLEHDALIAACAALGIQRWQPRRLGRPRRR